MDEIIQISLKKFIYPQDMTIPVILLNYNSSDDCRKCVGFLERQRNVDLEIIIVDNASSLDDAKSVEALCREKGLTFIPAETNRGYNAGNNIGLRYAESRNYRYALIANPDMEFPDPDYVGRLVTELEHHPDAVVVGSDIVTPEGIHQNPMLPDGGWTSSFGWIKDLLHKNRPQDAYSFIGDFRKSGQCAKLSGCALMIRMDFIKSINFFDEYPFLYCEEAILAKQVVSAARTMRYVADTQAIHRHISSAKGDPRPRFSQWRRSRLYYIREYSGYPWYGKLLSAITWLLYNRIMMIYFEVRYKFQSR